MHKYWFSILSLPLRLPGRRCAATASATDSCRLSSLSLSSSLWLSLPTLSSTLSACFGCSHGSICPLSDRRSLCLQAPHGAVHHFCIRKVPGTMNAVNKRLPVQLYHRLFHLPFPFPTPPSPTTLACTTANYACQK